MPTLERTDDVFVLDLGDDENRLSSDWLAAVNAALDEVERATGPRALVTAATGKVWTNGLDLPWLLAHPEAALDNLVAVQVLFARVLAFPVFTVAAVQGHAFGAGAMLAICHDAMVMRADRGFWCLPEADLGIPFSPGMSALVQARLAPPIAHEAMVTARRWGGLAAVGAGFAAAAVAEDAVRETAIGLAAAQTSKARPALAAIKRTMYAVPLTELARTDIQVASLRG